MLTDTGSVWEDRRQASPCREQPYAFSAGASGFCMANLQICCPCHLRRVLCLWPYSGVWSLGGFGTVADEDSVDATRKADSTSCYYFNQCFRWSSSNISMKGSSDLIQSLGPRDKGGFSLWLLSGQMGIDPASEILLSSI